MERIYLHRNYIRGNRSIATGVKTASEAVKITKKAVSFLSALGDMAKARGMAEIAAKSGLGCESVYKAFAIGKKSQFEAVHELIKALEMKPAFVPAERQQAACKPLSDSCEKKNEYSEEREFA